MTTLYRKNDETGDFEEYTPEPADPTPVDVAVPPEERVDQDQVDDVPFNEPGAQTFDSAAGSRRPRLSKPNRRPTADEPQEEPEFYVHLANGDVERVAESDLPGNAGHGAAHGFWEKDNAVHYVTGVYPVETEVKES
jgi:hypothetical protein